MKNEYRNPTILFFTLPVEDVLRTSVNHPGIPEDNDENMGEWID